MWYRQLQDWIASRQPRSVLASGGQPLNRRPVLKFVALFLAGGLGTTGLMPIQPAAGQRPRDIELTLVSFAVTRAAHDRIIPRFVEKWKREHNGQNVKFNLSYGGSGSQTRAVIDGLEADIVQLALALDTYRIQSAGLIRPGWEREVPNNGIVSKSVVVLVTRRGNPKGIRDWGDLAKNGVSVITANPKTSGVARWNFLALWGSVIRNGGAANRALDYVAQVYRNVPVLPRDAREATDLFYERGQGDVLINYENEAILANQEGQRLPYVVPQLNISIDNPIAVVDRNVDKHGNRAAAEAFVRFLYTPEAQRQFASVGFRPVNAAVAREFANRYPRVSRLYSVSDLGGWNNVQARFFADRAVFDQIQARIRR